MSKVKFKARTTAEIENLDIENGSLIYDTQTGKTYLDYNGNRIPTGSGSSGSGIPVSDTPPTYPLENDLWVDTTTDLLKRYNGTSWIIIGAEVDDEVSTTSTNAVQNQAITNYVNGIVLYENSSGATSGATLSDNISNYKYLEIFANVGNYGLSNKIDLSIKTYVEFLSLYADSSVFAFKVSDYLFSGTTMTRNTMYTKYSTGTYDATNENGIRVYKVIGYKE